MQIELSTVSDEQLALLQKVAPAAVAEEVEKRSAYTSEGEAATDLALVGATIEHLLENFRHTQAVRALKNVNAAAVIKRVLARAKHINGVSYEAPTLDRVRAALGEAAPEGPVPAVAA